MKKLEPSLKDNASGIIFLALFIPFLTTTLKNSGDIFEGKALSGLLTNLLQFIQLKGTLKDGVFAFGAGILGRILLLFIPFFTITIIELRSRKFKFTTLGRLKYSEGYKYADIWYFVINLVVNRFPQITIFTTLGLSLFKGEVGEILHNLYANIFPQYEWIYSSTFVFLILILSIDLIKYITHRLGHNVGLLWDLHEFHHSATEMTILSQHRGFAIAGVINSFIFLPFSILISSALSESISNGTFITLGIYVFDLVMTDFFAYFGHSSSKLLYPKPLNLIYMSPALHWLHHSRDEQHWQCNFGEKYPFWDKLFGTYLDESHLNEVNHYGVYGGSEYNKFHPLYSYTVVPILKIFRRTNILTLLRNNLN